MKTTTLYLGQSNRDAALTLLASWRDVSVWAKGELIAEWRQRGYLTDGEAIEVAAKTGARL